MFHVVFVDTTFIELNGSLLSMKYLSATGELDNIHDPYAVAITKEDTIVRHVPCKMSPSFPGKGRKHHHLQGYCEEDLFSS